MAERSEPFPQKLVFFGKFDLLILIWMNFFVNFFFVQRIHFASLWKMIWKSWLFLNII